MPTSAVGPQLHSLDVSKKDFRISKRESVTKTDNAESYTLGRTGARAARNGSIIAYIAARERQRKQKRTNEKKAARLYTERTLFRNDRSSTAARAEARPDGQNALLFIYHYVSEVVFPYDQPNKRRTRMLVALRFFLSRSLRPLNR